MEIIEQSRPSLLPGSVRTAGIAVVGTLWEAYERSTVKDTRAFPRQLMERVQAAVVAHFKIAGTGTFPLAKLPVDPLARANEIGGISNALTAAYGANMTLTAEPIVLSEYVEDRTPRTWMKGDAAKTYVMAAGYGLANAFRHTVGDIERADLVMDGEKNAELILRRPELITIREAVASFSTSFAVPVGAILRQAFTSSVLLTGDPGHTLVESTTARVARCHSRALFDLLVFATARRRETTLKALEALRYFEHRAFLGASGRSVFVLYA